MSMLVNTGRKLVARFGRHKMRTVKNYLKTQIAEEPLNYSQDMDEEERKIIDNSHYMLYSIYAHGLLLGLPTFYFLTNPVAPLFLQSVNLLQYYASGILCFNAFFTIEKEKYYVPFLAAVAASNIITGPYSVVSPFLLGALNFYFPFMDEQLHKTQKESQSQKVKHYMNVQALFYFLITLTTTLKCYHFFSVKELQKKLSKYQQENETFYSENNGGQGKISE